MNSINTITLNAQRIQQAIAAQQRGDLNLAVQLFEQVLASDPTHPDGLHFLGLLRHRADKSAAALQMVEASVRAAPKNPHFLNNLGAIYAEVGDGENAMGCYRKALSILPNLAEAQNNLGNLYLATGNPDSALACYRKAVALRPRYAEALRGIAMALRAKGKTDEARLQLQSAITMVPQDANLQTDLGTLLLETGDKFHAIDVLKVAATMAPSSVAVLMAYANALRDDEQFVDAESVYRQVLALEPMHIEALSFFGDLLRRRQLFAEADTILTATIEQAPENYIPHFSLGTLRLDQGLFQEAVACFQRAVELNPSFAMGFNNLGAAYALAGDYAAAKRSNASALVINPHFVLPQLGIASSLTLEGDIENAIEAFRLALEKDPDHYNIYMGLLMALQYSDKVSPQTLFEEHIAFGRRFEGPFISGWQTHANTRQNDRRLRVGYVSGDFRNHSVAYFIEPFLQKHDKSRFEIFCYANSWLHDALTDQIKQHFDHWAVCAGWNDEEFCRRIQTDQIDILVDLSGHTAHNRLRTFARKPAPIQVTWIGYPGTTGLTAMDYRITDEVLDPVGVTDSIHTEKLFRLDRRAATFRSPVAVAAVNPVLPALASGGFTFASLNGPAKTTRRSISLWAKILQRMPSSRLIIGNADAPAYIDRINQTFAEFGIGEERLSLRPRLPIEQFLEMHHEIDFCLDTFPYNGGTTTTLGIWMGVPTVTLAGVTTASRCGAATLSQLGLEDFIAETDDEYVACAIRWANDLPALSKLRASLRVALESSVFDATLATKSLESAFLEMWAKWCGQANTTSSK